VDFYWFQEKTSQLIIGIERELFEFADPDEVEYYRKRQQHISTIDTSPARVTPGGLSTYCTLRNGGIPLQDLNNIGTRPNFMVTKLICLYVSKDLHGNRLEFRFLDF